jgi:hypothetical protein
MFAKCRLNITQAGARGKHNRGGHIPFQNAFLLSHILCKDLEKPEFDSNNTCGKKYISVLCRYEM